jgi:hypothetical protein
VVLDHLGAVEIAEISGTEPGGVVSLGRDPIPLVAVPMSRLERLAVRGLPLDTVELARLVCGALVLT